jgi:glutamate 5-kinase
MTEDPRSLLVHARRVVVKVGSRLLAESPAGRPAALADEIAQLRAARKLEVVVVSSGAIALGVRALSWPARPTELPRLQAAAAIGQQKLMQHWEHAFSAHQIIIGQVLLTHDDIADRKRFLNARHALQAMLDAGAVPVINENDTVAVDEIKYGDNDTLSALVGNLVSADAMIILTDVDGLRDGAGARVPVVRDVDREAAPLAGGSQPRGVGSGGMASKVQAAKAAGNHGIAVAIAPGRSAGVLTAVLGGHDIGTLFVPAKSRMSSRKHWMAYGVRPVGRLVVDAGARAALAEKGRSLLPAGILEVVGDFGLGDVVSVVTADGTEFARGLAGYGAADLRRIRGVRTADIEATLGYKYLDEVIHRDDLVLL